MSKKNKKTRKRKSEEDKKKEREWGLLYTSPLVLGLKSLVPVLLVLIMGGLVFKSTKLSERRIFMKTGEKVTSPLAHRELAKRAAGEGDYELAEREYEKGLSLLEEESAVLGWESELESVVWPEKILREKIERWIRQVRERGCRELYLKIAMALWRLGEEEKGFEYWERAEKLDPNDRQVLEVKQLFSD